MSRQVTTPIRLAYVIKEMIMGGSQTHLLHVLRLLDRSRFEPFFYCLSGKGTLLDDIRDMGVPVRCPAAERGYKGLDLVRRTGALAQAFRADQIEVVHNYLLRANMVGGVALHLTVVTPLGHAVRGGASGLGRILTTVHLNGNHCYGR